MFSFVELQSFSALSRRPTSRDLRIFHRVCFFPLLFKKHGKLVFLTGAISYTNSIWTELYIFETKRVRFSLSSNSYFVFVLFFQKIKVENLIIVLFQPGCIWGWRWQWPIRWRVPLLVSVFCRNWRACLTTRSRTWQRDIAADPRHRSITNRAGESVRRLAETMLGRIHTAWTYLLFVYSVGAGPFKTKFRNVTLLPVNTPLQID